MSALATSHNYMPFFKECPIPISLSESTGLTLTLQLYQKLNEIRQKLFNKKYCNVGMTQQWSLAKKDKESDIGLVTGVAKKEKKSDVGMVTV